MTIIAHCAMTGKEIEGQAALIIGPPCGYAGEYPTHPKIHLSIAAYEKVMAYIAAEREKARAG